ncbi:putative F-box domain-containing protein [Helianthus annuus]|nr:putative F-box domain-containing protein [Helianthus annuus]
MSDHIPFEIQSEIMNWLPVQSLLRFRLVCKSWRSLIESSDFVAHYSSQQQHLLVRYKNRDDFKLEYVSLVDDDSFPQHRVCVTVPPLVNDLENHVILVGSSHGLLCFQRRHPPRDRAVIWNPSIRKAVAVDVPHVEYVGFGVCRETMDPKIVTITRSESVNPWQVEVFTLTTMTWRSPHSTTNFLSKSLSFLKKPVVVDGCLYWLARHSIAVEDGTFKAYGLIVSFDMTSEEFGEVYLPDRLAHDYHSYHSLSMYKLKESLVVIEPDLEASKLVYHVWTMDDGVPKTFQKLFTISCHSPDVSSFGVRGFRKTCEPLIELQGHPGDNARILVAYEPYSKSISNLGINGRKGLYYYVYSYMETLLLL